MNVGRYIRGEDRHVGTSRIEKPRSVTMSDKIRTETHICATDFGIPHQFAENAENYVQWVINQERERICSVIKEMPNGS